MQKTIGRDARIASYRAGGREMDESECADQFRNWNGIPTDPKRSLQTAPPQKNYKILLAIELAVAGVIVMLVIGSQILQNINQVLN